MNIMPDSGIPEAIAAYDIAKEWVMVWAILAPVLGFLTIATGLTILHYKFPSSSGSGSVVSLVLPFFAAIFSPLSLVVTHPLLLDEPLADLEATVIQNVEENVEFSADSAKRYVADHNDPQHVQDAEVVMTVTIQHEGSMYTSDMVFLYNETYDTMVPADILALDSLPIVEDSALAEFVSSEHDMTSTHKTKDGE